jgi:hypothetical protein
MQAGGVFFNARFAVEFCNLIIGGAFVMGGVVRMGVLSITLYCCILTLCSCSLASCSVITAVGCWFHNLLDSALEELDEAYLCGRIICHGRLFGQLFRECAEMLVGG